MNILLEQARQQMEAAQREASNLRRQYNQSVERLNKAKARWSKLSEAQMLADWELAQLRQRAAR